MILVLKKDTTPRQEARLLAYLEQLLSGGAERVDSGLLSSLPMVESVLPTADPLPLASRRSHPSDTVVQVGEASIGGGRFCMMAGPCTVESEEQLLSVARSVKASGAQLLRGGAYKPRTSPYDFSGLREKGLELLRKARRETGLPVVSEIMSAADLPLFEDVDILQVGARRSCCSAPNIFSPAATKTSSSASGASAPFPAACAAPWISPPCPFSMS